MTSRISGRNVLEAVSKASGIPMDDLLSERRLKRLAQPRMVAWLLMRELCPHLSFPAIARISNRMDHTTIISGVKRIQKVIKADYDMALLLDRSMAILVPDAPSRPRMTYEGNARVVPLWTAAREYEKTMQRAFDGRWAA